jgi:thiamine monophosphate synthase
VSLANIAEVAGAGADSIVVGRAVFNEESRPRHNLLALRAALDDQTIQQQR